jgi:hypothetical protein
LIESLEAMPTNPSLASITLMSLCYLGHEEEGVLGEAASAVLELDVLPLLQKQGEREVGRL